VTEAPSPTVVSPLPEELALGPAAGGVSLARESLRTLMWDEVGIVRHGAGLAHARDALRDGTEAPPGDDLESHEAANLALVGWVMAEAALRRQESRGAHYRLDFPEPRESWRRRQLFLLRPPGRGALAGTAARAAEVRS
jgi:aspartate oxidase